MEITREKQLEQLARIHGTDKLGHGYMPWYAKHLPESCRSLMEVGCCRGESLRMWNEFYGPDCDIWTNDLFKDENHMSVRACRDAGFVPLEGDQSDLSLWKEVRKQFDVFIEDGSHNSIHQIQTFKYCFINNVVSQGVYVVEDCHCCKDSFYWGGGVESFEDTILYMFQMYKSTGVISNKFYEPHEAAQLEDCIESVEIYNDQIIFIKRK